MCNDTTWKSILCIPPSLKDIAAATHMFMPARIPAAARPLSARPIMKDGADGAAADSAEPLVKTSNDAMNSVFIEKEE